MTPRLVFVHGIGGARDAAAEGAEWTRALAGAARDAGHAAAISGLTGGWGADVRFAAYGDLFRRRGAQGAGDTADGRDEEDEAVLVALLLEAVDERLADASLPPEELRALRSARAQLAPDRPGQGIGAPGRRAVNAVTSLLAVPGFRALGGWTSARTTAGTLGQVARYLNRREPDERGHTLDARIRARVADCLDTEGPTVVVAHSLGTVVALEALHRHSGPVPLLVTLGSPLGIRTAVLPRVRPQPVATPACVGRWLNFWDRDDIVAARPLLEKFVRANADGVLPRSTRVDADGAWVHPAAKYLADGRVAGPVMEALARAVER
ncbi:alpha/beta hydrolase [Streptomyces sp. LP05-1]|uniref:Alpha/beta hydrolase n=1 Tax=Streptomyces pyxinae TaxID=2970734 RepID=A0ABT2CS01_9ACTN|nr:alpha/beta fold hydrolase [Streptomyces sp. LP05-1]MCS0639481.1 alpha/beta hydrolase [Streptomyces sp. LP05-1]